MQHCWGNQRVCGERRAPSACGSQQLRSLVWRMNNGREFTHWANSPANWKWQQWWPRQTGDNVGCCLFTQNPVRPHCCEVLRWPLSSIEHLLKLILNKFWAVLAGDVSKIIFVCPWKFISSSDLENLVSLCFWYLCVTIFATYMSQWVWPVTPNYAGA